MIIAVGDVHGCHHALQRLIKELEILSHPCIFLGDYLDRGPSSIKVIDLLISAKKRNPNWKFLMGNHEQMFLEDIDSEMKTFDKRYAIAEYSAYGGIPDEHERFIRELLPWYESEKFIFVHGGIDSDVDLPIEQHELDELLWVYNISPQWKGKTIVRGHQIVDKPRQHNHQIDLDTGCFLGRFLTAGILDDGTGQMVGYLHVSFDGKRMGFAFTEEFGMLQGDGQ